MKTDRGLYRSTLLLLAAAPVVLFLATASMFGGRQAIEIGNAGLFAFSGGIALMYFHAAKTALREPIILFGDILSVGIFLGWSATFLARFGSIIWRLAGQDPTWLDSTAWGMHIAFSTAAALCHFVAPEAIQGRIPSRSCVDLGIIAAIGLFVAAMIALYT